MTVRGWHLVRVTLEAVSPLSCGSGEAGADADVMLVRDPNGLPMIPGSTIQGLLRALHPQLDREALFGREDSNGKGQAGRLLFSHARVHDSKDVAAGFPANLSDPLLKDLVADVPLKRDHVKLHHRHAAEEGAKFDRAAVPVGTRFSFEVLMQGEEAEKHTLLNALAYLAHPFFRVGGKGRRGYGKVMVHALHHGFFLPAKARAFRKVRDRPLSNGHGLQQVPLPDAAPVTVITLTLAPEGPWRSGSSGTAVVDQQNVAGGHSVPRRDYADAAPLREGSVVAQNNQRVLVEPGRSIAGDYVLPGSSVAGPLRHRTVFHWNRLMRRWIDLTADPASVAALADGAPAIDRLFGWSRPVARAARPDGKVSALLFEDLRFLPGSVLALDHVKIDAFTGGAFGRHLFDEELLETGALELRIAIDDRFVGKGTGNCVARQALAFAIRDLLLGRLAIGAKSYGFMNGTCAVNGPDEAIWKAAIDEVLQPSREQAA